MRSEFRYFEIKRRARAIFTLCVVTALTWVALTNTPAVAGTPAESPAIRVEEAWIRWLPAGVPAGGYATLTNTGDKPVILIAASSPNFGEVSVHGSVARGGMMEMMPVKQITIAPHSSVNFAAMGYHFMLMQPSKSLKPKDRVPITLRFDGGASLTVEFEVRE